MSDTLKRIEEKYNGTDHVLSPRSDVVKLARALDEFIKDGSKARHERLKKEAEHTLEEVAGE